MAKVRVYTDYDPIRILKNVSGQLDDSLAEKCGLAGSFAEIDESELPADRTHRNEWELKDGKVSPNSAKVQAKLLKDTQKAAAKQAVIAKLKITEDELKALLGA